MEIPHSNKLDSVVLIWAFFSKLLPRWSPKIQRVKIKTVDLLIEPPLKLKLITQLSITYDNISADSCAHTILVRERDSGLQSHRKLLKIVSGCFLLQEHPSNVSFKFHLN